MVAERTGVGLGDTLTFESGAQRFTAKVTSIRNVEWDSFNVNFFILMSPDAGELLPHQNIASFYLAGQDAGVLVIDQGRQLPELLHRGHRCRGAA